MCSMLQSRLRERSDHNNLLPSDARLDLAIISYHFLCTNPTPLGRRRGHLGKKYFADPSVHKNFRHVRTDQSLEKSCIRDEEV